MSKERKNRWMILLRGSAMALGLYLLGLLLAALLLARGTVPETAVLPVTGMCGGISVLCGAMSVVRRAPFGTLVGGFVVAVVFLFCLMIIGMGFWNKITWTGQGGTMMAYVLAGGVLAGLLGGRKRRKKKRVFKS